MAKYKKGDIVAVLDAIPNPNAMPNDVWGFMTRTFYGKVTGIEEVKYADSNNSRKLINFEIHNPKSQCVGCFEHEKDLRRANIFERLLYRFISKMNFPEIVYHLDKNIL